MKATIVVPYTDLEDIFASEDKVLSNNRASYVMNKTKDGFEFHIDAKDAVALRAMMSGITKTLAVFEKISKICQDKDNNK